MEKILVIGGGIGGLTAAIALQRKGIDVQVYESAPELKPVGAGIWVPTNAMRVLERLGLAEAVSRSGVPLDRIEVWDSEDGALLGLDLREVKARYGQTIVSVHRAELHRVLADQLAPGTLHLGKRCVRVSQDERSATAHFEDGATANGGALVGADGIHSVVRKALFPEVALRDAGQVCYRGVASMELPADLARTCREVWGGAVRIGFSAVGPQAVYWFAPVAAPAETPMPGPELKEILRKHYRRFPGPIPEILERTAEGGILRTELQDFPPIPRWHQGLVTLLGDAAHASTPNLGQGGAQAIEDAFVLAETLSSARTVNKAFRQYEHIRMRKARRVVNTAWRSGRIAHLRPRWQQRLRNFAMKSVPKRIGRKQLDWLYELNY
jgi:2-polyprenyl-6-methoxyphenol hydroxylase-like FAD-dependent oxidoreductase